MNNTVFKIDFDPSEEWEKIKVIGRGGSSVVYQARVKRNGQYFAAKEIPIDGLTREQVLGIEGEVETMKNLSHPNIVNYLGTRQYQNHFYIFMEYADMGSLRQFYQKNGPLTEQHAAYCCYQILQGLQYLHANGIAHRDVKGANVLMTKKGEMKLADFGASKRYDNASIISGLKGTPHWMAPEVIKGTQMTSGWMKADVWSLGCTCVELLTGALPFAEYENPMTAMYHIANGKTPPLRNVDCSPSAYSFVDMCCAVEPSDRPSVDELLRLPFVSADNMCPMISTISDDMVSVDGVDKSEKDSNYIADNVVPSISEDEDDRLHSIQPPPPTIRLDSYSSASDQNLDKLDRNLSDLDHDSSIAIINHLMGATRDNSMSRSCSDSAVSDIEEYLNRDTSNLSVASLQMLQAQMTPIATNGGVFFQSIADKDSEIDSNVTRSRLDSSTPTINTTQFKSRSQAPSANNLPLKSTIKVQTSSPTPSTTTSSQSTNRPPIDENNGTLRLSRQSSNSNAENQLVNPSPLANGFKNEGIGVSIASFKPTVITDYAPYNDDSYNVELGLNDMSGASPMSGCSPPNSSNSRGDRSLQKYFVKDENNVTTKDSISETANVHVLGQSSAGNEGKTEITKVTSGGDAKKARAKFKDLSLDTEVNSDSPASLLRLNPPRVHPYSTQNITTDRKFNVSFRESDKFQEQHFLDSSKSNSSAEHDDVATPLKEMYMTANNLLNSTNVNDRDRRPSAPLSSEKLKVATNGAEALEKASKYGTAAIRKHALNMIETEGKSKYSAKKQKGSNIRSKSAGVMSGSGDPSKLLSLPPMQQGKLPSDSQRKQPSVPALPLRIIQSAPSVSRSVNLPPIMQSKTPSRRLQQSSVRSSLTNAAEGTDLHVAHRYSNSDDIQHQANEEEQVGGILAPR